MIDDDDDDDAVDETEHMHKVAEIVTAVVKDENDAFLKEFQGTATDDNAETRTRISISIRPTMTRKPLMRMLPITRRQADDEKINDAAVDA